MPALVRSRRIWSAASAVSREPDLAWGELAVADRMTGAEIVRSEGMRRSRSTRISRRYRGRGIRCRAPNRHSSAGSA